MSLSFGIEAIASLIPIHLHLQKLSGRSQLRAHTLPNNHILHSLLESRPNIPSISYCLSLDFLTKYQCKLIKGPVSDMDNRFNKVFSSFNLLNPEFAPGCRIVDFFSNWFSFHSFNKHNKDSLSSHSCQLDNLALSSSENPFHALVITDASVKNNIATSIAHVHIHNKPVIKTFYYAVNINSTEAKLFAIRCSINQATTSSGISKIVVITDSIHIAKNIQPCATSLSNSCFVYPLKTVKFLHLPLGKFN